MTRLRIFVIDPVDSTRESLAMLLADLGHEVIACSEPAFCPGYNSDCGCSLDHACADVLVISQYLPVRRGLDFMRSLLVQGCRGLTRHMLLICDPNEGDCCTQAKELGARSLQTPLDRTHLNDLLTAIAREIPPRRRLVPLEQLNLPEPASRT
ncbi:MAG: hypothetical protein Kow00100_08500 [Geothermobacteraceae bacterium]